MALGDLGGKGHAVLLHVHLVFLSQVPEEGTHLHIFKMILHPSQLILREIGHIPDQPLQNHRFVIDNLQVMALLFRGIGNAVLNPLHISLDGGDGGAKVVGEIGHQQPPLLLGGGLRHRGGLQALADALQGVAELVQLPLVAGEDLEIQLSVPQIVRRLAQGFQGGCDPSREPGGEKNAHPRHHQAQQNPRQHQNRHHPAGADGLLAKEEGQALHQKLLSIGNPHGEKNHHRHHDRHADQQGEHQHRQTGPQELSLQGGFFRHGARLLLDFSPPFYHQASFLSKRR